MQKCGILIINVIKRKETPINTNYMINLYKTSNRISCIKKKTNTGQK